ncbi:MAG: disulfide bond formation protein DsbA [Robiginitomaculum sp.]|nr:MAG: disulfide bond formation protein DsbA [Robiginitomaculum sp.]
MPTPIDLYWSFRSPYSYLAVKPTIALEAEWDIDINVKIVLPLALRQPDFFESRGPEWMGYLFRDIVRLAEMSGQTLAMPQPDPVITDPETGSFAKEQPLVWRLSRLGVCANEAGRGMAFLNEVGSLVWSGKNWLEDGRLDAAITRTGLDLESLESEMDTQRIDALIHEHDKDLRAAGHWGVPTFVLNNEPFFGQDRIDALAWRLGKLGVARR